MVQRFVFWEGLARHTPTAVILLPSSTKITVSLMQGIYLPRRGHRVAVLIALAHFQGLFRSAQHKKQSEFLGRSFSNDKDRAAAGKNAFVLLAQHRPQLAAAFFILGAPNFILGS